MAYEERAKQAKNPMAKQCLELMARKQSNLSVAADVDTVEEMLDLAEKVCALMTFSLLAHVQAVHVPSFGIQNEMKLAFLTAPAQQMKLCLTAHSFRWVPTSWCSRPTWTSLTSGTSPSCHDCRPSPRNMVRG